MSLPLFSSYFSTRIQLAGRKYYGYDYVTDCPVDSVDSPFNCSPCSIILIGLFPNFGTVARSSYQERI